MEGPRKHLLYLLVGSLTGKCSYECQTRQRFWLSMQAIVLPLLRVCGSWGSKRSRSIMSVLHFVFYSSNGWVGMGDCTYSSSYHNLVFRAKKPLIFMFSFYLFHGTSTVVCLSGIMDAYENWAFALLSCCGTYISPSSFSLYMHTDEMLFMCVCRAGHMQLPTSLGKLLVHISVLWLLICL